MVTCCKDCAERCYKCHAFCKTYIQERAQHDAEIKAREESKVVYVYKMSRTHRIKEG